MRVLLLGSTGVLGKAGALKGFVRAAALEAPRNTRLVSPTVLEESWAEYGRYFRGYVPVAAADVACAYLQAVEGAFTGQIMTIHS